MDVQSQIFKLGVIFTIILLANVVFANDVDDPAARLKEVVCAPYCIARTLLPVLGFVLFVLAGVAYAAGQFFGAETRSKASSWAMSMIVGAIIAFVINILGPIIIGALANVDASTLEGKCACTGFGV